MRQGEFVVVFVALAGCASLPPPGTPEAIVRADQEALAQASEKAIGQGGTQLSTQSNAQSNAQSIERAGAQVRELVAHFSSVARLPAAEQKRELVQAAQAFGREGTPYARLKLGGLHALPVAGLRDDARALTLLEPLALRAKDAALRDRALADVAFLLYAQVAERQRLQREEREERQRLLREEARKQDALRERLEALKSIERSIMQREERSQPATR